MQQPANSSIYLFEHPQQICWDDNATMYHLGNHNATDAHSIPKHQLNDGIHINHYPTMDTTTTTTSAQPLLLSALPLNYHQQQAYTFNNYIKSRTNTSPIQQEIHSVFFDNYNTTRTATPFEIFKDPYLFNNNNNNLLFTNNNHAVSPPSSSDSSKYSAGSVHEEDQLVYTTHPPSPLICDEPTTEDLFHHSADDEQEWQLPSARVLEKTISKRGRKRKNPYSKTPSERKHSSVCSNGSSKSGSTQCTNCRTHNTPLWRRNQQGQPLCNACGLFLKLHGTVRPLSLKTDVIKKRNRSKDDTNKASPRRRNNKKQQQQQQQDAESISSFSSVPEEEEESEEEYCSRMMKDAQDDFLLDKLFLTNNNTEFVVDHQSDRLLATTATFPHHDFFL